MWGRIDGFDSGPVSPLHTTCKLAFEKRMDLVAALIRPERRSVVVANVGDSRAYFMSQGELDQITEDPDCDLAILR